MPKYRRLGLKLYPFLIVISQLHFLHFAAVTVGPRWPLSCDSTSKCFELLKSPQPELTYPEPFSTAIKVSEIRQAGHVRKVLFWSIMPMANLLIKLSSNVKVWN